MFWNEKAGSANAGQKVDQPSCVSPVVYAGGDVFTSAAFPPVAVTTPARPEIAVHHFAGIFQVGKQLRCTRCQRLLAEVFNPQPGSWPSMHFYEFRGQMLMALPRARFVVPCHAIEGRGDN
jgi:hypothetical protein